MAGIIDKLKGFVSKIINIVKRHIIIIPYVPELEIPITYSAETISCMLKEKFKVKASDISIADTDYLALPEDMFRILHSQIINELKALDYKYMANVFDCDNFAFLYACLAMLAAYRSGYNCNFAIGIAWSKTHAFNIVILDGGKILIVEPQNGEIIEDIKDDMYKPEKIYFLS